MFTGHAEQRAWGAAVGVLACPTGPALAQMSPDLKALE